MKLFKQLVKPLLRESFHCSTEQRYPVTVSGEGFTLYEIKNSNTRFISKHALKELIMQQHVPCE